ncbi:inositol hexakisphosphate and diphosphoinositol-pentakisphosphate kinase 2-like isoform X2 [Anneissia japonica]|uniref:inositol hexakisphosphate and diphosphoinositol-pentakisphosphate kinase 2-like isoform X2 n=1 Tax=Anneissia japonica TaxID=1529436 RepID=UPI0014256D7B|nr:inositol hexakisphosphate and diphosphoinositol-pentakisphosphate kinase 2-like isoform X2 [Anneissia japonica]
MEEGLAAPPKASFFLGGEEAVAQSFSSEDSCDSFSRGNMSSTDSIKIIIGICAMKKKSHSKPMHEILDRLGKFEGITIDIFDEEMILKEPVEDWPHCDCLISFFSTGFPLDKAIAYSQLRNTYVINDLPSQYKLRDRREVYRILKEESIGLPRYAVLNRDINSVPEEEEISDNDDQIEVCGMTFQKPFVEKPVDAEDHNVYIYYPQSAGGGSQRLFRKIGSRSSVYSSNSSLRDRGSFIYEEFMPTDGTDVKVYTVGPDYAHAEARKSPALDGKVERDKDGKEVRYPVILTNQEKLIARKVCLAFKQTVCGFDLLRANGKSYVCDVNGFSFVKNSKKYYDDCAKILGNMVMRKMAPKYNIPWEIFRLEEEIPMVPTTSGTMMELRCVIAVIRHGDRTPKQKMKMEVKHPKFFQLFEKYDGMTKGKIKLKRPKQLQEVLDVARYLLEELQRQKVGEKREICERESKLEQLKAVLEMYGHFSGINRKVQLKYQPNGNPKHSSSEEELAKPEPRNEPSLLLILKWGGELTPTGRIQAEELGQAFRCIYPGGSGDYAGFPGCGLLRLHSTYRHDLKIYASDEGRVQMTAASFTKGMLALEGELTPILVQMVKSANTTGLLDHDKESISLQGKVKSKLYDMFSNQKFQASDFDKLNPCGQKSITESMMFIKNPFEKCQHILGLIRSLISLIKQKIQDPSSKGVVLYHNETLELMLRRWAKLEKDFFMQKKSHFDITKIPDIYDCVKYDMLHNRSFIESEDLWGLYACAQAMADVIIPQEYGITAKDKLDIGTGICTPLLQKIKGDLMRNIKDEEFTSRLNPRYTRDVMTPDRHVRSRLYFTSESHIHSLLSCIRYGGLCDETSDPQWKRAMEYLSAVRELNYMSQIVIMLYEDPKKDPSSEDRFHVELHFSPGARGYEDNFEVPESCGFRPSYSRSKAAVPDVEVDSMDDLVSAAEDVFCMSPMEEESQQVGFSPPTNFINPHRGRKSYPEISVANRERKTSDNSTPPPRNEGTPPKFFSRDFLDDKHSQVGPQTSLFSKGLLNVHSVPDLPSHGHENEGAYKRRFTEFSILPGFDNGASMPSIRPLETLHNSLSLKQVDYFLEKVTSLNSCRTNLETPPPSTFKLNTFTPKRVLPTTLVYKDGEASLLSRSSSNPSSNVSSALPSPTENRSFDFPEFFKSLDFNSLDNVDGPESGLRGSSSEQALSKHTWNDLSLLTPPDLTPGSSPKDHYPRLDGH